MAVGTTRGKRRLGRFLRPLVERSGLRPDEIAAQAQCSKQTVYRLIGGDNLPRVHLFVAILGVLGASEDERTRAMELWRVADADTAAIEHSSDLPPKYMRFRMDEREAVFERTLDTVVLPGLLQTAEYASALSEGRRRLNRGPWENQAAERRDRQALLTKSDPLRLHALIDEATLNHRVGGVDVMRRQLDHLLEVVTRPHITVQIIPYGAGAYGAMSGPVILLGFPELDEPDSAYVESVLGLETVEDETSVAALSAVWSDVATICPSSDRSVGLLREAKDAL